MDFYMEHGDVRHVILPLQRGIELIRPNEDTLTALHPLFLQACLISQHYRRGYAIARQTILDVNPDKTGVNPKDALLFFYYSGMICTGLKRYDEALENFRLVRVS